MTIPTVAIIILNWNGKEDTIECLESLKQITYPDYEILLVDNGSTDGSVECFRERFPELEIIENGKNLGFAEGSNVGIRRAMEKRVDYVLLLNNDTIVDGEFLSELVEVAKSDPMIGIVGPVIYFYYEPNKIQQFGGEFKLNQCRVIYNTEISPCADLSFISGCTILIPSNIINEVGIIDSRFFAYYEDADYCVRVLNKKYKLALASGSKIWHKGSVSSGGYMSDFFLYLMIRNKIFIARKYLKNYDFIKFTYFLFLDILFRLKFLMSKKALASNHLLIILSSIKDGFRK